MANEEHLKILNEGGKAWNQWRRESSETRPDLSGANLCGANLRDALLRDTDLSSAYLSRAELSRAHLGGARLSGADLSRAVLSSADLSGAVLRGADLRGADLSGAVLRAAVLIGADLSGADLSRAVLSYADLSGANLSGANLSRAELLGATGPRPRMLKGITAAEDAYLQREANALARRMFRRRVKDPAKTLADLRARLRRAGWVHIKIRWSGSDTLVVDAGIGARLKAKLRESKFFSADERLFSGFLGASRKVGLKPGIEDLSVDLKGQRIEASVSAVPMADMSAVLDRMLDRWRDQDRARAARARKATT